MTDREPLPQYLDKLLKCGSIDDVWDMHSARMESYGFDRLLYGCTQFSTDGFLGDINDVLILIRGDQAYTDVYIGEELYRHSAINQWAAHNIGSISWGTIAAMVDPTKLNEHQLKLIMLNQKWGLKAGYSISLVDTNKRNKGITGLVAREGLDQVQTDEIWVEFGEEIEMVTNIMHLKVCTLPQVGQRRPLTTRQREALHWYGNGKTTRDIAQIMNLSAATVEKHLRCARESLDVETTAHAVLKATSLNQLHG